MVFTKLVVHALDLFKTILMKVFGSAAVSILLGSVLWQACSDKNATDKNALASNKGRIDFNYDVKPILSDKCFACHGPDVKKRQAEFRLDTEEGAFKALKSDAHHFAIVRGNPDESVLVKRIFSEDPLFHMPPPESNLVLTDEEKNILKKWIEQGAEYKKHWAFIPPVRPDVPDVDSDWATNDIDKFILAKLQQVNFEPSPEADKERLILQRLDHGEAGAHGICR